MADSGPSSLPSAFADSAYYSQDSTEYATGLEPMRLSPPQLSLPCEDLQATELERNTHTATDTTGQDLDFPNEHEPHSKGKRKISQHDASDCTTGTANTKQHPPTKYRKVQSERCAVSLPALAYLETWIANNEHSSPDDTQLGALATLTGMSLLKTAQWFNDRHQEGRPRMDGISCQAVEQFNDPHAAEQVSLQHGGQLSASGIATSQLPQLSSSLVLEDYLERFPHNAEVSSIVAYAEKRRHQPCTSGQISTTQTSGAYRCTHGCPYSTNRSYEWYRHEEKKHPQRFWSCLLCRGTARHLTHRPDKAFAHCRRHCSGAEPDAEARDLIQALVNASFVPVSGRFNTHCNQSDCDARFRTWSERNRHIKISGH